MEGVPHINRLEDGPETPKEHKELLKRMLVSYEEPAGSEEPPAHEAEMLVADLKSALHAKYLNQLDVPPFASYLLNCDADAFLTQLKFMDEAAVADLPEGATLAIDDRAQLVLTAGEEKTVLMRWRSGGLEIASFYQGPRRPRNP